MPCADVAAEVLTNFKHACMHVEGGGPGGKGEGGGYIYSSVLLLLHACMHVDCAWGQ
jgi:hypothetical protein